MMSSIKSFSKIYSNYLEGLEFLQLVYNIKKLCHCIHTMSLIFVCLTVNPFSAVTVILQFEVMPQEIFCLLYSALPHSNAIASRSKLNSYSVMVECLASVSLAQTLR